ncbi:MAG: hypothetical protein RML32_04210, partial [Gammaproteobacteria bacterium]|nr:hypothetical protein [Gammaproteobacteria bacterium]
QRKGETAVNDARLKLGVNATILFVKMQRCGIVRKCRKQEIIGLGQRSPQRMLEQLPYIEILKIQTGHGYRLRSRFYALAIVACR